MRSGMENTNVNTERDSDVLKTDLGFRGGDDERG